MLYFTSHRGTENQLQKNRRKAQRLVDELELIKVWSIRVTACYLGRHACRAEYIHFNTLIDVYFFMFRKNRS